MPGEDGAKVLDAAVALDQGSHQVADLGQHGGDEAQHAEGPERGIVGRRQVRRDGGGAGTQLEDCVNKGDLIAPACASAAGVICLLNAADIKITRCSSIGATIVCTGFDIENNKATYAGALYGSVASAATATAAFSGCSVSGKVGKTEDNLLTLTAENYFPYVGQANANCTSLNQTNITFAE